MSLNPQYMYNLALEDDIDIRTLIQTAIEI